MKCNTENMGRLHKPDANTSAIDASFWSLGFMLVFTCKEFACVLTEKLVTMFVEREGYFRTEEDLKVN